ncbi:class IV adenylate cyclase [Salarchaeum sp. JOR-1]|uniref:class IV adenylate cyclase n=1 Tax=Salarchaeum sp. JOR-1 TaxID=2599399 RepID=UPI001198781D|nr:class IV adenylate cyclase [Salarchaeum sp. JOR-1]QDX41605.1 class IV adenylate cyclase [Salarchaeum sp. JOR-1]
MYEVEVKVEADHERVRRELDERGADAGETVVQEDTYFDAPHRDFAETDEALRVREQATVREGESPSGALDGADSRVTYKGPLVDGESKTREEHETGVESGRELRAVLDGLGFAEAARVRKVRSYYALDGVTVTLDDVTGLGEYVEVELEVESEPEISDARERAYGVLRDLGLDPDAQIRTSYLGLLLE